MYNLGKLFNNLSQTAIETLISQVPHTIKSYASQEIIFTEVSFNGQLGILIEGEAHMYKNLSTGTELLLKHLHTSDLFGSGYVWGDTEYFPATIKAIKPCYVLFLPKASLKKLFLLEPVILDNFLEAINDSLLYLHNKIEMLAIPSAKERVLFVITQGCQTHQSMTLNKSRLCQELSISRASLYRCLEQLQEEHYIQLHSKGKVSLHPCVFK